jgi:hypothetical protein
MIIPCVEMRVHHLDRVLHGEQEPPYRYRVLKVLVGSTIEGSLEAIFPTRRTRHIAAYGLIALLAFLGIYALLHDYLRRLTGQTMALVGILLVQGVLPLTVTGYVMLGDYIALLFYLLGFRLMLLGRDAWLPLLVAVATLNRSQMIFLILFYGIYLLSQGTLSLRRKRLILYASILAYGVVFAGLRIVLGWPPSRFTIARHVARNTSADYLYYHILPLWSVCVLPLVLLSLAAWRGSNRFFRYSFLCLVPYAVAFFLKGNLWELAKFLPAYLILLPMGLQALSGRYVPEAMGRRANPQP